MSKFGTLQLCYTSSLYIITKKYVGTMLTMRAVCSVMNIKMGEKLKKKTWINVKKNMQITGVWKWCEPYPMAFTVTRSPLQWTYVRFWSDLLDSALHHQHQNNKITISFWKSSLHPSCSVAGTCTISATKHWNCSESLWWSNCITHLYFVKTVI